MSRIHWIKAQAGNWLAFQTFNLASIGDVQGVYVIWRGGKTPAVVYVGQGDISARLSNHRRNLDILAHAEHGLYVTWAAVPAHQMDGVERYLADTWSPLVGDAHPDSLPIAVNSPWG